VIQPDSSQPHVTSSSGEDQVEPLGDDEEMKQLE
jgi:hypothetical protein